MLQFTSSAPGLEAYHLGCRFLPENKLAGGRTLRWLLFAIAGNSTASGPFRVFTAIIRRDQVV
jgi:hypothetical protein